MPMYEYACQKCSKTFEKLVRSASDAENQPCPHCGSKQTRRALSVFAVGGEGSRSASTSLPTSPGMCGRCGGPGPCGME